MTKKVSKKIRTFFADYKQQSYNKGHVLVRPGEDPAGVMFIDTGEVRQYDISEQGVPVVVNLYRPLAFFPVSWAMNKTPNRYFFETITTTTLRWVPAEDVLKFLKENPDVLYDLLSRVFLGTDVLQRRMSHLMVGSAKTRILYELILEVTRFGQEQPDGSYVVPIHLYELAARTGLTRETASREMSKIKQLGIEITRSCIKIKDLDVLKRELGDKI